MIPWSGNGWSGGRATAATGSRLGAAACTTTEGATYGGKAEFAHGVASGDPAQTSVLIWTRVTPEAPGPVPVKWSVSRDAAFKDVVQRGTFTTGAERDYTVKVLVEGLEPGKIYLAPPDLHLSIHSDGKLELSDGRRIRGVLSSVNPILESAADVLGGRVVAVVLSGRGYDATDGVQAVRSRGGIVIAQDEATSEQFSMPRSAIASGAVDMVLPVERIGGTLLELASNGAHAGGLGLVPS